jgi:hypothetical protein
MRPARVGLSALPQHRQHAHPDVRWLGRAARRVGMSPCAATPRRQPVSVAWVSRPSRVVLLVPGAGADIVVISDCAR